MPGRGMHFAKRFTSSRSDLTDKRSRTFVPQRVATHFNCQNVCTNVDVLLNWYTNNKSIINWLDMYTVSINKAWFTLCAGGFFFYYLSINLYTIGIHRDKTKAKRKSSRNKLQFLLATMKSYTILKLHASSSVDHNYTWLYLAKYQK